LRSDPPIDRTGALTGHSPCLWDLPESDLIILYSEMEWTARATSKTVRFPAIELLRFRDGKVANVEMFLQDTKVILDTLDPD
jgi:hypothetical protein